MQNKKNRKPTTKNQHSNQRKDSSKKKVRFEDLLEDDRFDDEDYDTVTGDTLEFLSLDDDIIEAYQKEKASKSRKTGKRSVSVSSASKRRPARYVEEDYEDEDYEDDDEEVIYEVEEDEDDEEVIYEVEEDDDEEVIYEDEDDEEDYEDEDDEEDYEYYEEDDDEDDGFAARLMHFIGEMNGLDVAVAVLGILVLVGACITGGIYLNAKSTAKQVASFASVGEEIEGVSVIGESGLLAVSESAKLGNMIDMDEEDPEGQEENGEEDENGEVTVELRLTSILSDIKIKFVNKKSGKLIGGVPFEVEVSGAKSYNLKDDDRDGVIYQTDVAAGSYEVKILPLSGADAEKYKLPSGSSSVKVTDKIAYEKVDVADEVKSESEINVAQEEANVQNTVVESALKDTVEWVESTKTPIEVDGGDADYEQVPLESIPDPGKTSSAFRKMTAVDSVSDNNAGGGNEGDNNNGNEKPEKPEEKPDPEKPQEPSETKVDINLNTTSLSLEAGGSATLTVLGSDGKTYSADWRSGSDSVATVSGGTVTAIAAGNTTITAKVKAVDGIKFSTSELTCTLEVKAKEAPKQNEVEARLNTTELKIVKNQKAYLQIVDGSGKTYDAKTYATWEISDKSIADMHSDGQVKGLKDGSATIKVKLKSGNGVTFKNTELTCLLTVGEKNYSKVTISGKREVEVGIGQKLTLTAKSDPEGAQLVWICTDETLAKVDKNGVVTGVKEGKTKIRVACKENDKISDEIRITVKKTVVDPEAKLKDKDGNQLYYKKDGKYKEATYKDFQEHTHFYKRKASAYKYTGWQTIDGHLYYFDKDGNYVTGDQVIQGAKYSFGSDGKMAKSSGVMGIDVSKHNGNIDWNAVKNSGVSYVIIRCGYRGYSTGVLVEDPKFKSNIKGAKAAGLKVGSYFFSQAVNEVEAVEEASMAIDLVKGYGLDYPLFLDVEGSGGRADGISRDTRTAVCRTFCQTVQNSGVQAGVYANKTWFTEKINTGNLTSYKLWLAQYASAPTYTATRYDLWQYSSKGKVSGISGNVDMNISYVSY